MRGQNLRGGDVVFDEIRVLLQAREFDGEAIFDVAHNAAPGHSNRDNDAYRGRRSVEIPIAAARLRKIEHAAAHIGAIWPSQIRFPGRARPFPRAVSLMMG